MSLIRYSTVIGTAQDNRSFWLVGDAVIADVAVAAIAGTLNPSAAGVLDVAARETPSIVSYRLWLVIG